MRLRSVIPGVLALLAALTTSPVSATADAPPAALGGSGPYSAGYETSLRLPNHTIYRPNILTEWASHGCLAIANGRPGGFGSTDSDMLIESID